MGIASKGTFIPVAISISREGENKIKNKAKKKKNQMGFMEYIKVNRNLGSIQTI